MMALIPGFPAVPDLNKLSKIVPIKVRDLPEPVPEVTIKSLFRFI